MRRIKKVQPYPLSIVENDVEKQVLALNSRISHVNTLESFNKADPSKEVRGLIMLERQSIKDMIKVLMKGYGVNYLDVFAKLDSQLMADKVLESRDKKEERDLEHGSESQVVDLVDENNIVIGSKLPHQLTHEDRQDNVKILSGKARDQKRKKNQAILQILHMLGGIDKKIQPSLLEGDLDAVVDESGLPEDYQEEEKTRAFTGGESSVNISKLLINNVGGYKRQQMKTLQASIRNTAFNKEVLISVDQAGEKIKITNIDNYDSLKAYLARSRKYDALLDNVEQSTIVAD